MNDKPIRITATPINPLGERPRDVDPELIRQIASAQEVDQDSVAAALSGVSADVDPPGLRPPDGFSEPVAELNPDDDGKLQQEIDARLSESKRHAEIRKDAVTQHIAEIDSDANHPLRGASGRSRLPFGSRSARLTAPRREGFHRHWFNQVPDRIERALRAGYKMVNDVDGKPTKRIVGVGQNNEGLYAFYMEIPVEWYVQDMKASRQTADDLERAIRKGKLGAVEQHYVPKSGIEYEEEASGSYQPRA